MSEKRALWAGLVLACLCAVLASGCHKGGQNGSQKDGQNGSKPAHGSQDPGSHASAHRELPNGHDDRQGGGSADDDSASAPADSTAVQLPEAQADGLGELHELTGEDILQAAKDGIQLASFAVSNDTGIDVYATFDLTAVKGIYQRKWLRTRAFLRSDEETDTCLDDDPPCLLAAPREAPVVDEIGLSAPAPLPAPESFLRFRLVDEQTGQVVTCATCGPNEFLLRTGHEYQLQLVTTSLAFMLPKSIEWHQLRRFRVGPADDSVLIPAGIDEGRIIECLNPDLDNDPATCSGHAEYQLYSALTLVRIAIEDFRVMMRGRPVKGPRPPSSTPVQRADACPGPGARLVAEMVI